MTRPRPFHDNRARTHRRRIEEKGEGLCSAPHLLGVLLQKLHALVPVVLVLDSVSYTRNTQPLFLHPLDKLVGLEALAGGIFSGAERKGAGWATTRRAKHSERREVSGLRDFIKPFPIWFR